MNPAAKRLLGDDVAAGKVYPKPSGIAVPMTNPLAPSAVEDALNRGKNDRDPQHIQPVYWQDIPYKARRTVDPAAPGLFLIGIGGTIPNLVDFTLPTDTGRVIESIEIAVNDPIGRTLVTFRILKNETPIAEVRDNFTADTPFSLVWSRDMRLTGGQRLRISATNPDLFFSFPLSVRVSGWEYSEKDYGIKKSFDTL